MAPHRPRSTEREINKLSFFAATTLHSRAVPPKRSLSSALNVTHQKCKYTDVLMLMRFPGAHNGQNKDRPGGELVILCIVASHPRTLRKTRICGQSRSIIMIGGLGLGT